MKTLEDRILKKVYVMETRKTSLSLVSRFLIILLSGFCAFIFTQVLYEVLSEERTFDVFQIFSENWEVVSRHLGDIASVLIHETPKSVFAVIIVSALVFLVAVLTFVRNFGKMKHKLAALLRYWRGGRSHTI